MAKLYQLPKFRIRTLVRNTFTGQSGVITRIRNTSYGHMYIINTATAGMEGEGALEVWAEHEIGIDIDTTKI